MIEIGHGRDLKDHLQLSQRRAYVPPAALGRPAEPTILGRLEDDEAANRGGLRSRRVGTQKMPELPPTNQAIVQKNIALVERLAKQILELPQQEREVAIVGAGQSFREAGKADGIPEAVMERYVSGSIAALRHAVEEIGRTQKGPP